MFKIEAQSIGRFDVAVCGGGIAGACAAITAARKGANVILIERSGSLGGTLTEGFMPVILDAENKGGLVKEIYDYLNRFGMTCVKCGDRLDEDGRKLPGRMVDTEGCKNFFDVTCVEAGVKVLFFSQVSALNMDGNKIESILVTTECGNVSLTADVYIDATGNGNVAALAGCAWDCGDPFEKRPSPLSMGACVVGMPDSLNGTDGGADKSAYAKILEEQGLQVSASQITVRKLPSLSTWCFSVNFEYDVMPDDIFALSNAVLRGRTEAFHATDVHRTVDGYENMYIAFTSSHIGIREGRRIYGEYRISDDDILAGRRFEDGICIVTFAVDVHKLKNDDTTETTRGYKALPYHIPYRALVARDCSNLMLAGRCISGDFYPHASYRVMGNMAATGEAAGFAAAICSKDSIAPRNFDGKLASEFMAERGYEI